MQLSTLEAKRNRLQLMCNARFDVNKYSEQVIQLFNDIDKVTALTPTLFRWILILLVFNEKDSSGFGGPSGNYRRQNFSCGLSYV